MSADQADMQHRLGVLIGHVRADLMETSERYPVGKPGLVDLAELAKGDEIVDGLPLKVWHRLNSLSEETAIMRRFFHGVSCILEGKLTGYEEDLLND